MTEQTPDPLAEALAALDNLRAFALMPNATGRANIDRWCAQVAAVVRASGAGLGGTSREQITTQDALDALPLATTVQAADGRWYGKAVPGWYEDADSDFLPTVPLPATVHGRPDPAPDDTTGRA